MTGRMIGGCRILEKLGEGGMGSVYRAVDLMLERDVAVKVLRPELAGEPDIIERFRAEAVTLARLQHPNIATLYSLARDEGQLLMVMEFVRGVTIERLLEQLRTIATGTAVSWCRQVLDAMQYAHRKGVVHRDIKPANLMVTDEGTVKVTDFGIARVLGQDRKTRTGRIIGTAAYMAPEQIRGQDADARTDLYSLGAVLFELLSGRPPFVGDNEFSLMTAQVSSPVPLLRSVLPDAPDWIDAAVQRAMAKDPGDRFQSATEFQTVLVDGLQHAALAEDTRVVQLVARQAGADAVGGWQTIVPPTRLAPLPEPPPTRLAVKETRLEPSQGTAPGSGQSGRPAGPAAVSVLWRMSWRHWAGAAAIVIAAVALGITFSRRPPPPDANVGSPQPGVPVQSTPVQAPSTEQGPSGDAREEPRPVFVQPPPAGPRLEGVPAPREPAPRPPPADVLPPPRTRPPAEVRPPAAASEPRTSEAETHESSTAAEASYDRVRWVVAEGDGKDETDVVLEFRRDSVRVRPKNPDIAPKVVPYRALVSLSYSQARPSRWKRLILQRTSHWLTLETRSGETLLHLDSRNYKTIISAFESRTKLTVAR
ncbi:MAG: protein kinase [Acidobacteriota bacterium]